jgi:hypothetical protein
VKLIAAARAKTPSNVKRVGEAKLCKASEGGANPINKLIKTAINGGTNSSRRLKAHRTTVITRITPNKAIAVEYPANASDRPTTGGNRSRSRTPKEERLGCIKTNESTNS